QGQPLDLGNGDPRVSPDGKWVVVMGPTGKALGAVVVYPVSGGSPTLICGTCAQAPNFERGPPPPYVTWSPDAKFLYLNFEGSIYAIPLRPGQTLPPIPPSGFRTRKDLAALPGVRLLPEPEAIAGPNPSIYAYPRFATQRNIYRVPVP